MPETFSARELAEKLKVQPATVTAWARQGRIPAYRLNAHVIRFDLSAVMTALGMAGDDSGGR